MTLRDVLKNIGVTQDLNYFSFQFPEFDTKVVQGLLIRLSPDEPYYGKTDLEHATHLWLNTDDDEDNDAEYIVLDQDVTITPDGTMLLGGEPLHIFSLERIHINA